MRKTICVFFLVCLLLAGCATENNIRTDDSNILKEDRDEGSIEGATAEMEYISEEKPYYNLEYEYIPQMSYDEAKREMSNKNGRCIINDKTVCFVNNYVYINEVGYRSNAEWPYETGCSLFYGTREDFFSFQSEEEFLDDFFDGATKCHALYEEEDPDSYEIRDLFYADGKAFIILGYALNYDSLGEYLKMDLKCDDVLAERFSKYILYMIEGDKLIPFFDFCNGYDMDILWTEEGIIYKDAIPTEHEMISYIKIRKPDGSITEIECMDEDYSTWAVNEEYLFYVNPDNGNLVKYGLKTGEKIVLADVGKEEKAIYADDSCVYLISAERNTISKIWIDGSEAYIIFDQEKFPVGFSEWSSVKVEEEKNLVIEFINSYVDGTSKLELRLNLEDDSVTEKIIENEVKENLPDIVEKMEGRWYDEELDKVYWFVPKEYGDGMVNGEVNNDILYSLDYQNMLFSASALSYKDAPIEEKDGKLYIDSEVFIKLEKNNIPDGFLGYWRGETQEILITDKGYILFENGIIVGYGPLYHLNENIVVMMSWKCEYSREEDCIYIGEQTYIRA